MTRPELPDPPAGMRWKVTHDSLDSPGWVTIKLQKKILGIWWNQRDYYTSIGGLPGAARTLLEYHAAELRSQEVTGIYE